METDDVEIDRRQQSRVSVKVGVTMNSDSNVYVGLTDNVSKGGLFIATYDLLAIGRTIELEFRLPEHEEPIEVQAEVRWHRPESDPDNGAPRGFGARFVDLDDGDRERLEAFVEDREPMFHPL